MSLRRVLLVFSLLSLAGVMPLACSDSSTIDQNYGTDAAVGYTGPTGGIISTSRDAGRDTAPGGTDTAAGGTDAAAGGTDAAAD